MVRPPLTRNQVVLLVLILAIGGGVFVWDNYFRYDPEKAYAKAEKEYIAAMTTDTYGGQTPQETLDLFVTALRAEDIDLASKYFMLDKNLSREKWLVLLKQVKDRGLIEKMVADLRNAKPNPNDSISNKDFKYIILDGNGQVLATINFNFNQYSNVWKIESI